MDTPVVSIEEALRGATDQLCAVAETQVADRDPAHEDFYTWGASLDELTYRLGRVTWALSGQVERYGDRRILRDDAGLDPSLRLTEAAGHLRAVYSALETANEAARRYHSAVSHIAVEVDPEADHEEPEALPLREDEEPEIGG